MSNVIRFLETVGTSPALPPASYASMVAALEVGDAERRALLDRDGAALNDLLGGRAVMRCAVFEPSREPDQQPDGDTPDGDEEQAEEGSSGTSAA